MGECCSFKLLDCLRKALNTATSLMAEPSRNLLRHRGAVEATQATLDLLMGCLACPCILSALVVGVGRRDKVESANLMGAVGKSAKRYECLAWRKRRPA